MEKLLQASMFMVKLRFPEGFNEESCSKRHIYPCSCVIFATIEFLENAEDSMPPLILD